MNIFLIAVDKLSYLSPFLLLVIIFMGLRIKYKNSIVPTKVKIINYFLIGSLAIDITSRLFAIYLDNNLLFFNIYSLFEYVIIFCYLLTMKQYFSMWLGKMFYAILAFNLFEFVNVDFQNFQNFQSYSKTINSIFLLIVVISIVQEAIKLDQLNVLDKLLTYLPVYLAISAVISLPVNLLVNFIDETVYYIWSIHVINILLLYLVIFFILWKYGKTQKI